MAKNNFDPGKPGKSIKKTGYVLQVLSILVFTLLSIIVPQAVTAAKSLTAGTPPNTPNPPVRYRLKNGPPVDNAPSHPANLASLVTGYGINYHGGPVMVNSTTVYFIYYGDWATLNPGATAIFEDFANHIGGSPYFNTNTTYYNGSNTPVVNQVTFGGSTTDNYSLGKTLSDANILSIVQSAISGNKLPSNTDALYFVLTSSDVHESSGFGTYYCGWHTSGNIGGSTIKYSFVGDPSVIAPNGCEQQSTSPNGNAGADGMVSVIAHELEETVTDPQLTAWYDASGNENADKCAWTFGTTYGAANNSLANMKLGSRDYLIQQNWVNAAPSGFCALSFKSNQTVSFNSPADGTAFSYGTPNISLAGTATSGLTVSFSVTSGPCNVSGTKLLTTGTGTCVVEADQAGNGIYNAASPVSHSFTINKAQLNVTANNLVKDYSDPVPTLTALYSGFVNGDTQASSGISGAPGLSTTATQFSAAGNYPITTTAGTLSAANYTFHPVNGTLSVAPEKTTINYSGNLFVLTSGPSVHSATVNLTANLIQQADGNPGNLTLARVRFELFKSGNFTNAPDLVVSNVPVNSAGLAQTSLSLAADNWFVKARIDNGNLYWKQIKFAMSTLTVAVGDSSKRVTGGGWVADSHSTNGRGNFAFTLNTQTSGVPKGSSSYLINSTDGFTYLVKSVGWQSGGLSFFSDPAKAAFTGKVTVLKINPTSGLIVAALTNYRITVSLVDGLLLIPHGADKYAITIFNSSNLVWWRNGTSTIPIPLGSGNISVHKG